MATQQGAPPPVRNEIAVESKNAIGDKVLLITEEWRTWFRGLRESIDNAQIAIPVAPVESANDTLPTTSIDGGALSAGLFAVSWYLSVITAAATTSSAQVTIAWVDDSGNPKSYTGALMNGNTTSTVQVNERILIYSNAGSPITYAVAYASNPANAMTYRFRPVLQSVTTA
jgi:hypothetical protein